MRERVPFYIAGMEPPRNVSPDPPPPVPFSPSAASTLPPSRRPCCNLCGEGVGSTDSFSFFLGRPSSPCPTGYISCLSCSSEGGEGKMPWLPLLSSAETRLPSFLSLALSLSLLGVFFLLLLLLVQYCSGSRQLRGGSRKALCRGRRRRWRGGKKSGTVVVWSRGKHLATRCNIPYIINSGTIQWWHKSPPSQISV